MAQAKAEELKRVNGRARPLKVKGRNGVYHFGYAIEFRNPHQNILENVDYIGKDLLEKGDELEVLPYNHQEKLIVVLTKVDGHINEEEARIFKARNLCEPGVLK